MFPISIRGLTHMGLQFSEYIILYPLIVFRMETVSRFAGSNFHVTLTVRFLLVPCTPMDMGTEGFSAYEYVGDGAFAEHWLDIRPWTSVRIWEHGLQSCLGEKSIHSEKRRVEGDCSTSMVLWGLNLCTVSETISLPEEKLAKSQEFLAQPCFGPWVPRIDLKALQELRGKAEHWSLCNTSLAPEMHVVGRLLCSYRGMSRPHGHEKGLKQVYFDFWGSLEVLRINMPNPEWRGSAYRSSVNGVLTLPGRLSFNPERDRAVWTGSDATLNNCSAVYHTNRIFTVFETAPPPIRTSCLN